MKRLLIACVMLVPASGLAQKDVPEEPKTEHFIFDGTVINGERIKVPLIYIDAQRRVKFERIVELKQDFLPKLRETAKDKALR